MSLKVEPIAHKQKAREGEGAYFYCGEKGLQQEKIQKHLMDSVYQSGKMMHVPHLEIKEKDGRIHYIFHHAHDEPWVMDKRDPREGIGGTRACLKVLRDMRDKSTGPIKAALECFIEREKELKEGYEANLKRAEGKIA